MWNLAGLHFKVPVGSLGFMFTFSARLRFSFCFPLFALVVSGCGDSKGLVDCEGTVTYDNAPVEKGVIAFVPADGQQPRYSEITQGRYAMKGDAAPQPGKYSVEIEATKKVKDPNVPDYLADENGMVEKQYLPEKYNKKSELTVDIQEGQSQYDFHLEK